MLRLDRLPPPLKLEMLRIDRKPQQLDPKPQPLDLKSEQLNLKSEHLWSKPRPLSLHSEHLCIKRLLLQVRMLRKLGVFLPHEPGPLRPGRESQHPPGGQGQGRGGWQLAEAPDARPGQGPG